MKHPSGESDTVLSAIEPRMLIEPLRGHLSNCKFIPIVTLMLIKKYSP